MTLTIEQRAEMNSKARDLRGAGNPEEAEKVRAAIEEDRIYEPVVEVAVENPDRPSTHGPGSSLIAWQEYATAMSDLDPEIIASAGRDDLMLMLEAYGL